MITYNEIWNGWQESNYDSRYQTLTKRIGRIVHSLKITKVIMQKRRFVYENKVYFSVIKILNINGFWLWFSRVAHSRPGLSWLEGCQGAIWSRNWKWTVFWNVCSRSRSRRRYVTLPTKRIKAFSLGRQILIYNQNSPDKNSYFDPYEKCWKHGNDQNIKITSGVSIVANKAE